MAERITGADGAELAVGPTPADTPPADPAPPEPLPKRDQDAPRGYRADGQPKQAPGPKPRAARAAPPPPAPPPVEAVTDARRATWRAGIAGYLQGGAGLCMVAYNRSQNDAWLADAATLADHAAPLAEALVGVADQDAKVARVLDRVCAVGPYGALVTVAVSLGAQLAANHGRITPGAMGTVDKETLLARVGAAESEAPDGAVPQPS